MNRYIAFAAIAALAPQAAAQQQPKPSAADPAAPAPAVKYESVFSGYRGHRDEPLAPWREVNDEVARAGGHIGILRGAGARPQGASGPAARPGAAGTVPGPAHGTPRK